MNTGRTTSSMFRFSLFCVTKELFVQHSSRKIVMKVQTGTKSRVEEISLPVCRLCS
jgi:hypothetical protein